MTQNMIEFKCHCSQAISVADDQAGGLIQCPACGRLNDIPTLSDLKNLDAEGGFKISELEIVDEPQRLQGLTEAFTRERLDDRGEEIDLRPSFDDIYRAGVEEIPLSTDERDLPGTPKYDPITGELIEAIKIKPDPKDEDHGPLAVATPVLGYAGRAEAKGPSPLSIGLHLFFPQNVIVLFVILWVHIFLQVSVIPVMAGLFFFAFVPLGVFMLLAGHYGRVVQETGPGEQDELPRPFGSLSLREDFWEPFVGTTLALAFAYGPMAIALPFTPEGIERLIVFGISLAWGALTFPAAFLTTMTSGTLLNLRPDRVIGVIFRSGASYILPMILFTVGPVIYFIGVWGLAASMIGLFVRNALRAPGAVASVGFVSLVGGILLAHWGCWALGMIYRAHNANFPWVFQRHIYQNRTRRMPPPRGAPPPANVKSRR